MHAAHALARGQFARRIVVDLPAGEDLDVESSLAQVKARSLRIWLVAEWSGWKSD